MTNKPDTEELPEAYIDIINSLKEASKLAMLDQDLEATITQLVFNNLRAMVAAVETKHADLGEFRVAVNIVLYTFYKVLPLYETFIDSGVEHVTTVLYGLHTGRNLFAQAIEKEQMKVKSRLKTVTQEKLKVMN